MPERPKCGKPAASMIPRLGMYHACVLDKGHKGDCERGGTCFAHGTYLGEKCLHWPACTPHIGATEHPDLDAIEKLAKDALPIVSIDAEGRRITAYNPDATTAFEDAMRPQEVARWVAYTRELEAERERYRNAIIFALGEHPTEDWPERGPKQGNFYWRDKLAELAALKGDK